MQIRCTSVWLSCPGPALPSKSAVRNPSLIRRAYRRRILHREPHVKRYVGQTLTNCAVLPYRQAGYNPAMCRSIKTLRRSDGQAADDEVRAAALQFVRKVSGYRTPSRANEEAFNSAVEEIDAASRRLLGSLKAR